MLAPRSSLVLAAAAAAALTACGGATTTRSTEDASTDAPLTSPDGTANGADGANADAGASGDGAPCDFCLDAASDVPLSLCPSSPPAMGSACSRPDGEECEYGSSWWLGCNSVFVCRGGTWQPSPVGGVCISQDAGGTCPASWAEANAFDAGGGFGPCPAPDCQYPEGYCECLAGCGGGGAPHPMLLMGRWYCSPATPECPSPRPDLGTACSSDAGCMYGEPCGCGQQLQCLDGVWQGYPLPPCP